MCGGYMRDKYVDCYANYIVKFIKAYAEHGIKISAITPQNETNTQQNGKMPACIWHPETEARFIKILRQKLHAKNLDVKIWMYDHNFDGEGRVDWSISQYPSLVNECDGIAFHYYSGTAEQTVYLKNKYPKLSLHFTEGGPRLYDNYSTDWCKWGIMMSKTLGCGYSSFTWWKLMLDEAGGPNVGPFFCGGLVTRDKRNGELSYSGQYKAFRHISPFISPDSVIYKAEFKNDGAGMFEFPNTKHPLVGAVIENKDSTALVLANANSEKAQVQYFIDGKWWYIELLPDTLSTVVFQK
jgi:glucosylceramidase